MSARAASLAAALLLAACDPSGPELDLPPRPGDAPGGAEVVRAVDALDLGAREARLLAEVSRGNVPGWLRRLRRVDVTGEVGGRERRVSFWVTPDYLAVGSDDDFLLVPLSTPTADRVADLAGASLPTPRMVDAVWASARVRLAPIRFPPDELMASVGWFARHDGLVKSQRLIYDVPAGAFVAGHKLDLVRAPGADPASISALYGWHRPDGRPIQPFFTFPSSGHVVYSHGVRLVHRDVLVDGERRDLLDVLVDPGVAPLLGYGADPEAGG